MESSINNHNTPNAIAYLLCTLLGCYFGYIRRGPTYAMSAVSNSELESKEASRSKPAASQPQTSRSLFAGYVQYMFLPGSSTFVVMSKSICSTEQSSELIVSSYWHPFYVFDYMQRTKKETENELVRVYTE